MSTGHYIGDCHVIPCPGDDCPYAHHPMPHYHTSSLALVFPGPDWIVCEHLNGVFAGDPDDLCNWVLDASGGIIDLGAC